ncbi:MAG: response regulator [Phyllobacteriaceae bacterium]|nr:response regulator [Phyllobacteriaceae bacterium]
MTRQPRILVVDDERVVRESTGELMELAGLQTSIAADAASALAMHRNGAFDVILSDLRMPQMSGLDLLQAIKRTDSDCSFVMMTGHGDVPVAVEAMRLGADDFIEKPCSADVLVERIKRIAERALLRREIRDLQSQLDGSAGFEHDWPGSSAHAHQVRAMLHTVCANDDPVLVAGPKGSGRSHIARTIHQHSVGHASHFLMIDAATIASADQHETLFGGATYASREGLLRANKRATICIRNAETLAPQVQDMLVAALRDRQILPAGGETPVAIDCRLIMVTQRASALVSALREAFGSWVFELLPLSRRAEDIASVFAGMVSRAAARAGTEAPVLSLDLISAILAEADHLDMRQMMDRAHNFALGTEPQAGDTQTSLKELLHEFERGVILARLAAHRGNQSKTAQALRIPRRTLGERIAKLGIDPSELA